MGMAAVWLTIGCGAAAEREKGSVWHLMTDFGPTDTPQEAQKTFELASQSLIEAGGGVLVISRGVSDAWRPENTSQSAWRVPEPPAVARRWGTGPAVTVLDIRNGVLDVHLPQLEGMRFHRMLNLREQGSTHWRNNPVLELQSSVIHGAGSFSDYVQEDVEAGPDRRVYVLSARGLYPGMFINVHDVPGAYRGRVNRAYIQSLGYDTERNMPFFVADLEFDVPKGAIAHNKIWTPLLHMQTHAHTEDQTEDIRNERFDYSQGDSYMFNARFSYMGDVHSAAGDENGVAYATRIRNLVNAFRGEVQSWDAQTGELQYTSAVNAHTLGSGRPMINMNQDKWVVGDNVIIVRPGHWTIEDPEVFPDPLFEGNTYPTRIIEGSSGNPELRKGGLIRFPADSPVNGDVVGRYFAVDEPTEKVPRSEGVRRWYRICEYTENQDGTRQIRIVRHWWGAKSAGAPTLYREDNYSRDGSVRPLRYVIAPGANVTDVSRGVRSTPRYSKGAAERILVLSPASHRNTEVDFEPGDPLEQAVGPDPFRPIPFRAFISDLVPGVHPDPVLDVAQRGVQRHSLIWARSNARTLEQVQTLPDRKAPFKQYFLFDTAAESGLVFNSDFEDAAIVFRQPGGRKQTVKWYYGENRRATAELSVDPEDGRMHFAGEGGMSSPGGLSRIGGLSASEKKARNLRGVMVPVPAGVNRFEVVFEEQEPDDEYAVFVELSWLTLKAIPQRGATGFTVEFSEAPGENQRLDWMIVR